MRILFDEIVNNTQIRKFSFKFFFPGELFNLKLGIHLMLRVVLKKSTG